MERRLAKLSKFLSLVLRHQPERIGLALDDGGWADVADLIARANSRGINFTRPELEKVLATNAKQRFAFNSDGARIRARQGHSVEVNLGLAETEPPMVLFHGTAERFLPAILREGLKRQARHHVHLSADEGTARLVGQRHGRPVVLRVDTAGMRRDGASFFRSENNVWLTETVPPGFLAVLAP